MMNSFLPEDIRVLDCVEVSEDFSARFDCVSREYLYFFMRRHLDVVKMNEACKKLIGLHDFRNICRLNVIQNDNYMRRVIQAGIFSVEKGIHYGRQGWHLEPNQKIEDCAVPMDAEVLSNEGSPFDLFYLRLRATAFLWNQVDHCELDQMYNVCIVQRRKWG